MTIAFYEVGICGSPVCINLGSWVDSDVTPYHPLPIHNQLTLFLISTALYSSLAQDQQTMNSEVSKHICGPKQHFCVRGRADRQTDGKRCELWVMGLESHRHNIIMDSSSMWMCKSSTRYTKMITGKSKEKQSSGNRTMLRCTRDSMHAIVQTHG